MTTPRRVLRDLGVAQAKAFHNLSILTTCRDSSPLFGAKDYRKDRQECDSAARNEARSSDETDPDFLGKTFQDLEPSPRCRCFQSFLSLNGLESSSGKTRSSWDTQRPLSRWPSLYCFAAAVAVKILISPDLFRVRRRERPYI